ncbi:MULTISPECIES: swarming motility protein SwrAA [Bacillaceae]|uniref:swarming motility protein SwrAA n=1 Tax=Bacillaceae TaxID=186817 RepID=UPI002152A373|nr:MULTISPECIES: swarming motility protein SwrAA [Bacillaceae]
MKKRASVMREQTYRHLAEEFKMRLQTSNSSHAKVSKWVQLFCMYLANYTEVKKLQEIDKVCIQEYFHYLTENYKRLSLNLTDIKRSMQLIEEVLDIKVDDSLLDFSLSNLHLWSKLK